MIINVANFNFGGDGGGGGKPALLQEKTATIVQNGSQTITPDEGFDGMSSVQINAAITGASSAIDFSSIGYDAELSAEVNSKMNDDVAYSKSLFDAWNPSNTSAFRLYIADTKLVYAPKIDTSNVNDMESMFSGCTSLQTVPFYNTSNVFRMTRMFSGCTSLQSIQSFDTSNVTLMDYMFSECSSLKTVPYFNTSKVINMNNMFYNCSGLTSVPLFDTSNVTSMEDIFSECSSLTTVPLFDTSKVTDMTRMFSNCSNLESIPSFDTRNATDTQLMFYRCQSLTSVPELDTRNVTSVYGMFSYCNKLTTIEGISFKSFSDSTMDSNYLVGYGSNTSIRKAVFKDIGYQSTAVQFNTEYIDNWGVNTSEIPDARQSLIDSLITYSFDRASAGYPICTIKLSSTTKALLTEDEKAQITAKGFTIA